MSIMPGGKVKGGGSSDDLTNAPTREVFVKDTDGTMKGTGMIMLEDNTLLAPEGFGAESGSINFGDLITLSEASGFLAIQNNLNGNRYRLIDHYVPRNAPSSKPGYIQMIEAETEFDSQPDQSTTLTANPLIFSYTTQLTSRVNSIKWRVASRMTNVRIKITKTDVNVAVKYYPSKASWSEGVGGVNFEAGDHVTDFLDTPLLFTPGTTLQFEIRADNLALKGSSAGVASFTAMVQRGEFKYVAIADDISAANIKTSLESLLAPNKLSKTAIQDSVNTVNGQFGDVTVTATSINAQPVSINLTNLSALNPVADKVLGTDSSGAYAQFTLSPLSKSILASNSGSFIQSLLGISVPTNVSQLTNDAGYVTSTQAASVQVNADWASSSGKSQILNKPSVFPPASHTHAVADVTGLQSALDGKVGVGASIPYSVLTNTPTIPTNNNQLTNGSGFVTAAQAIAASPVQSVNGQTGAVVISIPTVNYPVSSVNSKTGAVVLTNTDVGAAATSHTHLQSDITGLTAALAAKADTSSLSSYATNTALTAGLATKADASSVAKVRYYTTTSDSNSVWTVNLGTDFTTVKDVQVQPVSVANTIAGIRQASLNAYTATSTSVSGITYGNNVLSTVLISAGTNALALAPTTAVRIRVEGV